MREAKAGRPAQDIGVDARIATPIGLDVRLLEVGTRANPSRWSFSPGLTSAGSSLRLCAGQAPGCPGDVRLGIIDRLARFKLGDDRPACLQGNVLGRWGRLQHGQGDPPCRRGALGIQAVAVDAPPADLHGIAGLFGDQRLISKFDPRPLRVVAQYAISMASTHGNSGLK